MQMQKDEIRKRILLIAHSEFKNKCFKDASMRIIAKKSGVGLSNIYNYFTNKDEIFCELLSGFLKAIELVMLEHNSPKYVNVSIFGSEEYLHDQIDLFTALIADYKEELYLLFFKSAGSSLENFREEYTEKYTKTGIEYITMMKEKYPEINSNVSVFFIHAMSSWWMTIISELVMHDLTNPELEGFIREYVEFGTAGWGKMMKIHKN